MTGVLIKRKWGHKNTEKRECLVKPPKTKGEKLWEDRGRDQSDVSIS